MQKWRQQMVSFKKSLYIAKSKVWIQETFI